MMLLAPALPDEGRVWMEIWSELERRGRRL